MAGAFVAVADDATAVYWNPAGVGDRLARQRSVGRRPLPIGLSAVCKALQNEEDTGAIVAFPPPRLDLPTTAWEPTELCR